MLNQEIRDERKAQYKFRLINFYSTPAGNLIYEHAKE